MKRLLIILGIVLVLAGLGFLALQLTGGNPDDVIIEDVDISKIEDGVYEGEYETALVNAKVEVTVENGEIINIDIISHDCGPGHSGEDVAADIVYNQQLEVDTISGSTMSSKVIMKAVENALK